MATNFGFMPVLTGKRYFVSYKSEDTERIGEITRKLNQMGVPMWYDYGIEKGKRWTREINKNINECEAVILFATKALFAYEDTYVQKEFQLAEIFKKSIYIVWVDNVSTDDVNTLIMDWFVDLKNLQGTSVIEETVDKMAWTIVNEFHLINGMPPQPLSPTYQPPVPRLNVRVGDRIPFGQYPQGANGEVQPLEWRVLAVENGRALLITDKLSDAVIYNSWCTEATWETCRLREWMNDVFFYKAFDSSQQALIAKVTIQNPNNPEFGTKGGNDTQDKIFALSFAEAQRYFRDDDDRMAAVTEYAKKRGVNTLDDQLAERAGLKNSLPTGEKAGIWWLRSPGYKNNKFALVVGISGNLPLSGDSLDMEGHAVRPALWLNLE